MFSIRNFRSALLREGLKGLVAIVITGIVIIVSVSHISRTSTSLVEERKGLATLQAQQAAVGALQEQLSRAGNADTAIEASFVTLQEIDKPIAVVEALTGTYGLTHHDLKFDVPQALPATSTTPPVFPLTRAPFTITLSGSAENLIKYLNAFEHLPFFIRAESISILAPQDGSWMNNATITLKGSLDFRAN